MSDQKSPFFKIKISCVEPRVLEDWALYEAVSRGSVNKIQKHYVSKYRILKSYVSRVLLSVIIKNTKSNYDYEIQLQKEMKKYPR